MCGWDGKADMAYGTGGEETHTCMHGVPGGLARCCFVLCFGDTHFDVILRTSVGRSSYHQ